jgi:RNA polymerase-interacting CarD/CdnL/TRCF family regulator
MSRSRSRRHSKRSPKRTYRKLKGGEIKDISKLLREVFKLKNEYEFSCNDGAPVKLENFGQGGSELAWNIKKKNLKKALCQCNNSHCDNTPAMRFTRDFRSAL